MRIYFDSNTKKIRNINESFLVYNEYAILNRLSEFPTTLFETKTRILRTFRTSNSCKNDVTPSIVNVTMPYVIDEGMEIELAIELRQAGLAQSVV